MVLTIAHRGASAHAPENTLAAVRRAVAIGADLVEVDVHRSRDGQLVVLHDETLTRTTDVRTVYPGRGPWRVADFSVAELARLDAGAWKGPAFRREGVPTLSEVAAAVAPGRSGLLVELKKPGRHPALVGELADLLVADPSCVALRRTGRLVVQSFDIATMKALKTRVPDLAVGLLGTPSRGHLAALSSWADQVNPAHRWLDRRYVDHVRGLGMGCNTWTADSPDALRRALAKGVSGVITNHPERLLGMLVDAEAARPGGRAALSAG